MSILSIYFLAFLLLSTIVFYLSPNKIKPYVILVCNIYFYLQFDIRYSLFLFFSIITIFAGAQIITRISKTRIKQLVLALVLICNIGLLFFVKFTPYILKSVQRFTSFKTAEFFNNIIVPIGISFYTLQVCGYLIDVYRGKYAAEKDFLKFMSFSSFFPLMLQGPISRYDQLSNQIFKKSKRDNIYLNYTYGAQLMLWGFFKKLVIADRAALMVNEVFDHHTSYSGLTVLLATLLYTLQIYTDFSGCVDICRGAAQLFGINIIENFRQPYFAKSIQDFWKRWHIALSSWFRDYLYIPLGGNRKGIFRKYVNLLLVFFVSGLWHGEGIHFIVWGILQGVFQIIGALTLSWKEKLYKKLGTSRTARFPMIIQWIITLGLINISWLFFRANTTTIALKMFASIFNLSNSFNNFPIAGINSKDLIILFVSTILLFIISYYREKGVGIRDKIATTALPVRWTIYLLAFAIVLVFGIYGPGYSDSAFIYMNF